MVDEPYSVTSAATVEPVEHPDTDVDVFTRRLESQVTNLVGGFSSWWSNVNQQVGSALTPVANGSADCTDPHRETGRHLSYSEARNC